MPEMNPVDEFDSLSGAPVPGVDEPRDGAPPSDGSPAPEVQQLRKQIEDTRALYLRTLADFENYKRRMERDLRTRADEGRRALLSRLLGAVDNLQRAADYRSGGTPPEQLVDGVLATVKQFEQLLDAENVTAIETMGKPFDPAVSEAVGTAPNASVPDGTVIAEARRGYRIGDEMLRPAQVIVAKHDD